MAAVAGGAARPEGSASGLVGRTGELSRLRRALDDARRGRGGVVLVSGEPGIGKTRLAQELAGVALAAGVGLAWGRCDGDVGHPPLWPWREVLRSLDLPDDALVATEADEPGARFRAADEVVRALAARGDECGGLLVVLDDAHWADAATLLVLRHVAARAPEMPVCLLVNVRGPGPDDGGSPALAAVTGAAAVERVELRGLSVEEVAEQLEAAGVPGRPGVVHDVTDGNPLFVRELARAMAAHAWEVGEPPPRSVLDVVRARVVLLSEPCQDLLGWAAVAGRDFDVALLARAAAVPVERCVTAFDEARAHGIVERRGPPAGFRFVHVLLRDALTASLDGRTRVAHHAALARALEAQGDVQDRAGVLAGHWIAAAPMAGPAPARRWATAAAEEAVQRLAFEDGARLYRAALALGDAAVDERCRLLLGLARAAYLAGDLGGSAGAAEEAGRIADELGDVALTARAALVVEASTDRRANAVVRQLCDRALSRVGATDTGLRARLLAQRSHVALYDADLGLVRRLSAEALAMARSSGDDSALIDALRARQEAAPGADGREERTRLAEEMIGVAGRVGDTRAAMWGHLWAVDALVEEGRLADAASRLERLADTAREVGGPVSAWLLDRCVACIAQGRGDLDTAAVAAERAHDRMRAAEPEAALGAYLAIHCAISHHRGTTAAGLALAHAPFSSPALFTTMRRTGRALLLARAELLDAAATEYELAGPPSTWRLPPFYVLPGLVVAALAAAALDRVDDLRMLVSQLEPFRGQHVVGGAGVVTYLGPVELHLGAMSLRLSHVDAAIDDLTAAGRAAERGGAAGYLAEARQHLASALLARDGPGDVDRARSLADASGRTIHALGLDALAGAGTALGRALATRAGGSVLSPREEEVAALVAEGLTNPQIAERLVISTRTAQNHVQHILTKLGFSSRSQIAAWTSRR